MFDSAALAARLTDVRDRIARAANRAGRDPASVTLIAVSKTFSSDHIRAAADAGQLDFGENKIQEGLRKIEEAGTVSLRWHLIGHLQSNKARQAARFLVIHALHATAKHWWMGHYRDLHPRQIEIKSELLRAVTFCPAIKSRHFLSNKTKLRRILQPNGVGHRLARRALGKISITC